MIRFINKIPDWNYVAYRLPKDFGDRKVRHLTRCYSHLECVRKWCYCAPSEVHVTTRKGLFHYFIALSCCREFERYLTLLMLDEVIITYTDRGQFDV